MTITNGAMPEVSSGGVLVSDADVELLFPREGELVGLETAGVLPAH